MKSENFSLLEKLKTKDKFNDLLQSEKNLIEDNLNSKITDIQNKFDEKNKIIKDLKDNYDSLDKEFKGLVKIKLNFI